MKIVESLLLFGSLGLLAMFTDQFLYKRMPFADSYFFLMFGIAGIFFYTYRRGLRIMQEKADEAAKNKEKSKKIEDRLKKK